MHEERVVSESSVLIYFSDGDSSVANDAGVTQILNRNSVGSCSSGEI